MVVYTAIFGDYDELLPPLVGKEVPHICFTDAPLQVDGWDVRQVRRHFTSSQLEARMYKLWPHVWLHSVDVSIWRDGNIQLAVPPDQLVGMLGKHDIALFKHPLRDCIYEEAKAIVEFGKAPANMVKEQAEQYRRAGYPEHHGLAATGVVVRCHNDNVERMNNVWWVEVIRHTARDQMSFDYVCWRLEMEYTIIPGNYWDNEWVVWSKHKALQQ